MQAEDGTRRNRSKDDPIKIKFCAFPKSLYLIIDKYQLVLKPRFYHHFRFWRNENCSDILPLSVQADAGLGEILRAIPEQLRFLLSNLKTRLDRLTSGLSLPSTSRLWREMKCRVEDTVLSGSTLLTTGGQNSCRN